MLRIGDVVVKPLERWIERDGSRHRVDFKAMEVLLQLVAKPGNLVTKNELFEAVWPQSHVSDNVLPVAIRTLRKAFGDDAAAPRFIETVPRVGYRLIAAVEEGAEAQEAAAQETEAREPVPREAVGPPLAWSRFAIGLLAALAVVVSMVAFARWGGSPWDGSPVVVEVREIVVEGDTPGLASLADEIGERLLGVLSREPATLPRKAAAGSATEPAYVVAGVLRQRDERIRLTVQLSHRASGTVLWSPHFEAGPQQVDGLPERVRLAFMKGAVPALRQADKAAR